MLKRIFFLGILVFISIHFSGCVTKKTFELKEQEVKMLESSLAELQARYDQLREERSKLEDERDVLLREKAELIADNKELNRILKAESDDLSKTIAQLREEISNQKSDHQTQVKGYESWGDELGKRISELMTKNKGLKGEIGELQAEIKGLKQEKEEEVKKLSSTYEDLLDKMKGEIDKGQVTISELKGKLTVNMVDAVLFDSGQAEIKDDGLVVLQKVVDILKTVTDKAIRVEGHTDNVKIIGGLAQKYPTNWELSAARAINVTRFLQEQGLDPKNLGAVAYGEFQPVADNSTDEGKAQNRRIEIVLVAKEVS